MTNEKLTSSLSAIQFTALIPTVTFSLYGIWLTFKPGVTTLNRCASDDPIDIFMLYESTCPMGLFQLSIALANSLLLYIFSLICIPVGVLGASIYYHVRQYNIYTRESP